MALVEWKEWHLWIGGCGTSGVEGVALVEWKEWNLWIGGCGTSGVEGVALVNGDWPLSGCYF